MTIMEETAGEEPSSVLVVNPDLALEGSFALGLSGSPKSAELKFRVLSGSPKNSVLPLVGLGTIPGSPKSTSTASPTTETTTIDPIRLSSPGSAFSSSGGRRVKFSFDDTIAKTTVISTMDERKRGLDSPRSRASSEFKLDTFAATVKVAPGSPRNISPRAASKTLVSRISSSRKGVLKNVSPTCESDKKKLMFRLKKEERALEFVKLGQELTKWTHSGKQLRRFLKVSEDGLFIEASTKLFFASSSYGVRKIEIAKIQNLVFGPRTIAFSKKLNWESDASWRCFSIITNERTWDFMADSDDAALLWFFGIQSMCVLSSKSFVSWAKLLWIKAILKSAQTALIKKVALEEYWNDLALKAKAEQV